MSVERWMDFSLERGALRNGCAPGRPRRGSAYASVIQARERHPPYGLSVVEGICLQVWRVFEEGWLAGAVPTMAGEYTSSCA